MSKRVLLISIKAGAGHLRAAQALEAAFAEKHPDVTVKHIEALEYTNKAFRKTFTAAYDKLVTHLPSVWGYLYEKMERKTVASRTKKLAALMDRMSSKPLLKEVEKFAPDAVICTHYFPSETLAARRRKGKLAAPVFTALTDYDIHTMWVQEGVDRYFVATEEMAYALRAKGIGQADVTVSGIPVMPAFAQKYPDKQAMRRRLKLTASATTVLLAAGGFGLAGIDQTVALLADEHDDVQFVAVAGRNDKLRRSLEKVARSRGRNVVPLGFVTNMHEWMAAADFFVGKCGGLTTSECLALGLPMVIFSPIRGQEERNADFLLENGVALRANTPAHLRFKVNTMLSDPRRLGRMKAAAKRIAKPRAAYTVVRTVLADIA